MEYLMTYGWAILIIAVVLAALFELGVFNPMTFAPKASPGSCQVVRPEGAGTTNFISLEGECNGELPQYVAQFNNPETAGLLNGNGIKISKINLPTGSISRTLVVWFKASSISVYGQCAACMIPSSGSASTGVDFALGQYYNRLYFGGWADDFEYSSAIIAPDTWNFAAASYIGGTNTITVYFNKINTTATLSGGVPLTVLPNIGMYMGMNPNIGGDFNGSIADIQVYNTSLSANDIQALYKEGIGGAPIDLQHLVGWWPLNGNANDYSGNVNNGVPTNVIYTSNWYSGYSAP